MEHYVRVNFYVYRVCRSVIVDLQMMVAKIELVSVIKKSRLSNRGNDGEI